MYVYYDANGKLLHSVEAKSPNIIPPINSGTPLYLDDVQYAQLYNNGNPDLTNWSIQNNTPVYTPVSQATLLASAKTAQKVLILSGLDATLIGGFTSKTTGHKYVTTTNGQSNMEGDLKRFELDNTLATVQFFTIDQGWLAHTYDQLKSAFLDGGLWKDAQYAQQTTLNNQIDASTTDTVAKVQAIVWTEATY